MTRSSSPSFTFFTAFSSTASLLQQVQQLDLGPLRQSLVSTDSQRFICSYEFEDGTCRDASCKDLHTRDLDPDGESYGVQHQRQHSISTCFVDEKTAHYIAPLLPNFAHEQINAALAAARRRATSRHVDGDSDPLRRRLADAVQQLVAGDGRQL